VLAVLCAACGPSVQTGGGDDPPGGDPDGGRADARRYPDGRDPGPFVDAGPCHDVVDVVFVIDTSCSTPSPTRSTTWWSLPTGWRPTPTSA
jgi:hypothetical protein